MRYIYDIVRGLGRMLRLSLLMWLTLCVWLGCATKLWAQEPLVGQGEMPPLSQEERDSIARNIRVGIIVASPSPQEVYTLYGHAGLRVQDKERGIDVIFNYGLFQFDDDFLYKFIKGETDYFGAPELTTSFIRGYTERGSVVTELMLDLPPEVIQHLMPRLGWSISPEHRVYRYNFFKDNCATRPLWLIWDAARAAGIPLEQSSTPLGRSWRDEINELERPYPWLVLGTDLALGSPTDAPIDSKEATFLPSNLRPYLGSVSWINAVGDTIPLIFAERVYMPEEGASPLEEVNKLGMADYLTHPYVAFATVLLLTIVVTFFYKRARPFVAIPVHILTALGSLLLCYIAFFTEHPSVWPNYNLIVLHPLHILGPLLVGRRLKLGGDIYHFVNFVLQLIFLVGAWSLPQKFNPCVYMLSVTLLLLSFGAMGEIEVGKPQDNDDGAA